MDLETLWAVLRNDRADAWFYLWNSCGVLVDSCPCDVSYNFVVLHSCGLGISVSKMLMMLMMLRRRFVTYITLWENSTDDKLMTFFLFFPENRI